MVRDTKTLDELIERSRDISMSPAQLRAQQRSFVFGNRNREPQGYARDHRARRR